MHKGENDISEHLAPLWHSSFLCKVHSSKQMWAQYGKHKIIKKLELLFIYMYYYKLTSYFNIQINGINCNYQQYDIPEIMKFSM